ncbi:hypothetical protein [Gemmatimonas groenlandica]|uniref:Uncharacterized protein n=1 Tax=Gemmatimonas groenlandica TaxID=2732249 RepID=A0A6M4INV0_9BACT|nr:hypothetical protein [Gemmatimonas groenlandica]QJR35177.1 hypothetical protein HKW67_06500 [Gemmatimonas groenlandica]
MTESRAVSIDEVRSLVAERQRYDDWLTALDARRAETPSRVFDRVHGDYVARRDAVMAQLREHVGSLSSHGDELDGRLSTLEAELATLEDERVEAMLRTAVGEYDDDRWETVRQDVETKIASLGEQRGALLTEIDEIRTLLSSASSEPLVAAVEAPAEDVTIDEAVEAVETVEMDSVRPLFATGDLAAIEPPVSLEVEPFADVDVAFGGTPDVMSDVRLVTEMPELVPTTSPTSQPTADQSSTEFDDALAMFADSTGTPDPTFTRSLEGIEVELDVHGATSMSAPSAPQANTATATPANSAPVDAGDVFDDLAFLRSVIDPTPAGSSPGVSSVPTAVPTAAASNEPLKTLRCTECGTMNLPTEWYCERCGGELAAF